MQKEELRNSELRKTPNQAPEIRPSQRNALFQRDGSKPSYALRGTARSRGIGREGERLRRATAPFLAKGLCNTYGPKPIPPRPRTSRSGGRSPRARLLAPSTAPIARFPERQPWAPPPHRWAWVDARKIHKRQRRRRNDRRRGGSLVWVGGWGGGAKTWYRRRSPQRARRTTRRGIVDAIPTACDLRLGSFPVHPCVASAVWSGLVVG